MGMAVLADSTIFARDGLAVDHADGVARDRQFFVRRDGVGEQSLSEAEKVLEWDNHE